MTLGSFFIAARRRSRLSLRMAPSPRAMARARAETKASSASSSSWLRSTGRLVLTYLPVGGPKDMALERSSETRYETGDGARTISRVGHVARGAPLCRERAGARPLSGARGCPPCPNETSMATESTSVLFPVKVTACRDERLTGAETRRTHPARRARSPLSPARVSSEHPRSREHLRASTLPAAPAGGRRVSRALFSQFQDAIHQRR